MATSTSVTKPRERAESFRTSLTKFEPTLASVLPSYIPPERVIALTLTAATKNPALFDCTMESVALSLIQVAQWDLEIGRTAHLVPFGKTCTAIADWKGLVELMIRSGHVRDVKARAVYKNEHFRVVEGLRADIEHVPSYDAAHRGDLFAFYAVAFLARGGGTFEVLTKEDVDTIRNRAQSKDSPAWKNHYVEMGKKSAIRRLAKRMPQSPQLQSALTTDDRLDAGELLESIRQQERRVVMGIPPERPRQMLPAPGVDSPYDLDASGRDQPRELATEPAPPVTPAQRAMAASKAQGSDPYASEPRSGAEQSSKAESTIGGGVGEVGNGAPTTGRPAPSSDRSAPSAQLPRIPFTHGDVLKGTVLRNIPTDDLAKAARWARGEPKWDAFVEAADEELERRSMEGGEGEDGA